MPRKRKPYIPPVFNTLGLKDEVADIDLQALYNILSYMRVSAGTAEQDMITKYIEPTGAIKDEFGNYHLNINKADDTPSEVLWSAHTDSVHTKDGQQKLYLTTQGIITLADKQPDSNCLGADDGAGIWLLLEMIKAKVPGYYIFHREEESGGVGSRWLAQHSEDKIKDRFKYAIAFDRKSTDSIITKQRSQVCCSQEFVDSLAALFPNLKLTADPTGSFTDTASYTKLISECTNISVGYLAAHSKSESQDIKHLLKLRDSLLHVFDESKLVAKRDPSVISYGTSYTNWGDRWDDDDGSMYGYRSGWQGYGHGYGPSEDSEVRKRIEMGRTVGMYPYKVGELLMNFGYDADTLLEELFPSEKESEVIHIGKKKNTMQEEITKEMEEEAAAALEAIRNYTDDMTVDEDRFTNEGGRIHEQPIDGVLEG